MTRNTLIRKAGSFGAQQVVVISPGDSGINQTGVAAQQQTGVNVVPINGVSGAAFSSAGAGKIASLPAGTFNLTNFTEVPVAGWLAGAAINTPIGGIYGAGSSSTIIQLPPGSTPPDYTDPVHYMLMQGNNGNYTNPGAVPDGYIVDGITLKGVQSSINFGGVYSYGVQNFTLSNSTIAQVRGNAGGPPGETFMWNFQRPGTGTLKVKNVTFDGAGEAAAGLGTNYQASGTVLDISDSVFKNTYISAGVAIHGAANGSTIVARNTVMTGNHRNWGIEANGANCDIYDPLWDDKNFNNVAGITGHDFNITWTVNNYEGRIRVFFTTMANYNAFKAMRTNPKFTIVGNFQAYGDSTGSTPYAGPNRLVDYFEVWIGGVKQVTTDYSTGWNGAH